MTLTRDDVVRAYRLFLDREPESEEVVAEKLSSFPTCWSLASAMVGCAEFSARMRSLHGDPRPVLDPRCSVRMTEDPVLLARLRDHVRETWTQLGRTSPHHSVLTGPEFLPEQITPEREQEFYATGAAWVEEFAYVLRRNGLVAPQGLILDFGCGLGRVGEHLSAWFDRYLGVDISPSHLFMACDRLARLGRINAEFQLLPDFMSAGSPKVDAVYCVLVLQHNPPPVMLEMLNQLLSRLSLGGIGFIQIPTAIYDYNFDTESYLDGLGDVKQMEMHALPQRHIFASFKANDCDVIEVYNDGCAGSLGESYRFLVQKVVKLERRPS